MLTITMINDSLPNIVSVLFSGALENKDFSAKVSILFPYFTQNYYILEE